MSRLSIPRRHDGVGAPRHRLANVVAATHVIGSVCRLSTWLLEPLLPLLTCCLLALFGASVTAAMRSEADGPLLGENGSLVNFTSARRLLYEVKPPLTSAKAAAAAANADSSVASAEEASQATGCPVLTAEIVKQLCTDLTSATDQLPSLSVTKAHRLEHCDMFDFRHLIVHADSLVDHSDGKPNCREMLKNPGGRNGTVTKTRCEACLQALINADNHVADMARLFTNLLDKYQCYLQTDPQSLLSTPSPASSSSSSASNRRRNASGEVGPANKASLNTVMTPQTHPGSSNCASCRVAYRGWLCTKKFKIYPLSTISDLNDDVRFGVQPACYNWCAAVETNCPYFTPGEDQQNGGEPVFLCDEKHYHHSSHYRVPSDPCELDSRRHSCCYLRQDTDCRPLNKTCPPLKKVCNSTVNTSTSSPSAPQRSQYLPPSQNATHNATSPGAARTISAPLLLLTAFLILQSCRRELT